MGSQHGAYAELVPRGKCANLHQSDEAIEMVDAATGAHDLKGEAQLVGAMIEDSPYPEVSGFLSSRTAMANILKGPRCREKLR